NVEKQFICEDLLTAIVPHRRLIPEYPAGRASSLIYSSASGNLVHGQRHSWDSVGGEASCDREKSSQINKRSSKSWGDWKAKSGRSSTSSTRVRRAAAFRTRRPFGRLCG